MNTTILIHRSNLDILHSLKYISVNIVEDNKYKNISVVPYYEIVKIISYIREELKKDGYYYYQSEVHLFSLRNHNLP